MTSSVAGIPLPRTAQDVADAARELADDAARASAQLAAAEGELRSALEAGDAAGLLLALGRRDAVLRDIDGWIARLRQAAIPESERSHLAEMLHNAVHRVSEGDLAVRRAMTSLKATVEQALAEMALPAEATSASRAYDGSRGRSAGLDRRG